MKHNAIYFYSIFFFYFLCCLLIYLIHILSSVQSLSCIRVFVTPWTTACQASLPITNSWSLPKCMSIESVMPSNHLILCHPLLLLPSIIPSIRVFSNESTLRIRWLKYRRFGFSMSPSNEYSGLIYFSIERFDLLAFQKTLESLLQYHSSKVSILRFSAFFCCPALTSIHDYWKNHIFDYMDLSRQSNVCFLIC